MNVMSWNTNGMKASHLYRFAEFVGAHCTWDALMLQEANNMTLDAWSGRKAAGGHQLFTTKPMSRHQPSPVLFLHQTHCSRIVNWKFAPGVVLVLVRLQNGVYCVFGSLHAPHGWGLHWRQSIAQFNDYLDTVYNYILDLCGDKHFICALGIDANAKLGRGSVVNDEELFGDWMHEEQQASRIERRQLFMSFCMKLDLRVVNTFSSCFSGLDATPPLETHTPWNHGRPPSQIDFVLVSRHLKNQKWKVP